MHINIDRVFTTVSRNLGLEDWSKHIDSWVEWAYEAEKLIGSVDTFVQKEATYTSTGAQASGTITFAENPTTGDSITLNGAKFYFKRYLNDLGRGDAPNEFNIHTTLAETMSNTSGGQYGLFQNLTGFLGTSTAPMGTVLVDSAIMNFPEALNVADYACTTAGVLTITAKEIGPQGNDYTISSDNSNAKVSGLTLTGGKGIYRNQQIILPENNIKVLGVRVGTDDSTYGNAELRKQELYIEKEWDGTTITHSKELLDII